MFSKRSILIVDTDAYLAGIYARRFEEGHWQVMVAETAEEAKKAIRRRKPNVLLVDIETVERSLDLVRALREHSQTADIALVVLTKLGDRQMIEAAFAAGADSYLLKGHFVPSEVRAKVERLVVGEKS